jgi:HD-like signal output (HDOD) protein
MVDAIIKRIQKLPPLPKTIEELNRMCNQEDVDLNKITAVLEKDPMLVANILKRVNSPYYSLSKEVKDISYAISFLGIKEIRNIVIENSIKKLLNIDMEPYGIKAENFTKVSYLQSLLVKKWLKLHSKRDFLSLAALLQENGKILIADIIINENLVYNFRAELSMGYSVAEVEKNFLGVTSAYVSAKMFEYWRFDKELVDSIYYSDFPKEAPKDIFEYSAILFIVKNAVCVNSPLSEISKNRAISFCENEKISCEKLKKALNELEIL